LAAAFELLAEAKPAGEMPALRKSAVVPGGLLQKLRMSFGEPLPKFKGRSQEWLRY
jgi:hypothetical protein